MLMRAYVFLCLCVCVCVHSDIGIDDCKELREVLSPLAQQGVDVLVVAPPAPGTQRPHSSPTQGQGHAAGSAQQGQPGSPAAGAAAAKMSGIPLAVVSVALHANDARAVHTMSLCGTHSQ